MITNQKLLFKIPDGIFVSLRGNSMRVSPHLHNTQEDLEALINAIAKII